MRFATAMVPIALVAVSGLQGAVAQGRVPPPLTGAVRGGGAPQPPLLTDFLTFSVMPPPPELALDPFYKKYANAQGIPVVSSGKVSDVALLMARDIVFRRPTLRDRRDAYIVSERYPFRRCITHRLEPAPIADQPVIVLAPSKGDQAGT